MKKSSSNFDDENITPNRVEDKEENSGGWWNSVRKNDTMEGPSELINASFESLILGREERILQCENYRKILIKFYKVHAPQKLDSITFLAEKFKKNHIKLRQLIKQVEGTYNVTLLSEQKKGKEYQISSKPKKCVRNNKLRNNRGKMVNFIYHLEKAHQSTHFSIDQESAFYKEYLLDICYCSNLNKKRNNTSKKKKTSIIYSKDNLYLDEINFQKRRLSKRNSYNVDERSSTLTAPSSHESLLTQERLEKFQ